MQLVLAVVRVNDIHEDYHWPINAWVELYTVTLRVLCRATHVPDIGMHLIVIKTHTI